MKELAYVAGYFDGEGCIMFSSGTPRVVVTNTFRPKLAWLQDAYGGSLSRASKRTLSWRTQHAWRLSGDNARRFLLDVLGYLEEKREQAEIALKLCQLDPADRGPLLVRLSALKRIDYADNPLD